MHNLHLNNMEATVNQLSGTGEGIVRRQFLKTIGIVGVGVALWPTDTLALAPSEAGDWVKAVVTLLRSIFPCGVQAEEVAAALLGMGLYYPPTATTFHGDHGAPFVFGKPGVDPVRVTCDNGFQIAGYPYYDARFPCRSFSDLNRSEIMAIASPQEFDRFQCVVTPTGHRQPFDENNDHAIYDEALSHYKETTSSSRALNPDDWRPVYKRRVSGHGKAHTGFHVIHKTKTTPFGKPKSQFIISGDI